MLFNKKYRRKEECNLTFFKPSMFNHYTEDKDSNELVLYNSYLGMNYLLRVTADKKQKVISWLSQTKIVEETVVNDADFECLKRLGYFVNYSTNEKHLREVLLSRLKADNTLRLVIHTSKSCNFRCKYCYLFFCDSEKHDVNLTKETQEGIINYIKKNISNYKAVHIDWFGGEPLLDVKAIDYISEKVIEICCKAKKPYEAVITTNGYLLSEQNVAILLKNKVKHIAITIDGLRDQHDSQRVLKNGGPTFDRIIENLEYIRDNVKTRTLSISIRSNITVNALDRIEEYYRFYNEKFGNDKRFYLFVRPVKDMGGEQIDTMNTVLFQNNSVDFGVVYDRLGKVIDKIQFNANFVDLSIGGMRCYSNNLNRYTIGVDGMISKCDESIEEIRIGQLLPSGQMIIDEIKHAEWLRTAQCSPKCDDCFYSCCCFMDPCPKARVMSNTGTCPAAVQEIDALLRFCAKSCDVKSL